jgi:hypothetical protein
MRMRASACSADADACSARVWVINVKCVRGPIDPKKYDSHMCFASNDTIQQVN